MLTQARLTFRLHRFTLVAVSAMLILVAAAAFFVVSVVLGQLAPVLILPFSILFYHEKVSLRAIGGAIVAVAGVAMLMLSREEMAQVFDWIFRAVRQA